MGMATCSFVRHQKPAWIERYPNVVHCDNCGAVFNKNTKFVRGYNVSEGTMTPEFVKVSDCKENCCPVCSTPIVK